MRGGGLVGFALVGGETHYTNSAYSTECTATTVCNPAAPWVTARIYASIGTKDAYDLAFEDGATAANGWNNDGDFNDDFFLTGISINATSNGCAGTTPVCSGSCVACNADFGSDAGSVCQSSSAPHCLPSGSCTAAAADAGPADAGQDATVEAGSTDAGGDADAESSGDDASASDADGNEEDASPVDGGA